MVSPRILKQVVPAAEVYELVPQPTRHDRERAAEIVREAREEAAAIIADAEARAAAIRWEAEQERETAMAELRAAVLEQARKEAEDAIVLEMDETFIAFRALVEQAVVTEEELRRASQAELVTLAVAIAEQIIQREIASGPSVIEQVVARALEYAQAAPVTRIMVHPDDLETVQRWLPEALGEPAAQIELMGDTAVGRGGCVIGTKTGFIDARIETQLAEVRRVLAEAIDDA